jgi:hypothetical protein
MKDIDFRKMFLYNYHIKSEKERRFGIGCRNWNM